MRTEALSNPAALLGWRQQSTGSQPPWERKTRALRPILKLLSGMRAASGLAVGESGSLQWSYKRSRRRAMRRAAGKYFFVVLSFPLLPRPTTLLLAPLCVCLNPLPFRGWFLHLCLLLVGGFCHWWPALLHVLFPSDYFGAFLHLFFFSCFWLLWEWKTLS